MNGNDPDSGIKQKRSSRCGTSEAKSRNWRFLFDNLKRAVGYIYSMCEQDGDIEECKEAIMVLHNRIKEFEGLIQYIEVQASYETSEERPSSVAWEVPVSAIKQPSLPFQPNGDPQLYYYPCLPQTFPQYSMPGTFPMMDPNIVNFMPFNQQFAGYPADYLGQNGTPPQPPQQYQQYGFSDYNNNVHSKKNYSKHRRSGSKHDSYKSRNSDGHLNKKHHTASSSGNLNSLDIMNQSHDSNASELYHVAPMEHYHEQPKAEPELINYLNDSENKAVDTSAQEIPAEEIPAEKIPAEEIPAEEIPAEEIPAEEIPAEEIPAEEIPAEEIPAEEIPAETTATLCDKVDEGKVDEGIVNEAVSSNVSNYSDDISDLKHDKSFDSIVVNQEIAEAIDDKSSVEGESLQEHTKDSKAEWTVVTSTSDNFVHVTSDGSDHSLPTSPDNDDKKSQNLVGQEDSEAKSTVEESGTDVTCDSQDNVKQGTLVEKPLCQEINAPADSEKCQETCKPSVDSQETTKDTTDSTEKVVEKKDEATEKIEFSEKTEDISQKSEDHASESKAKHASDLQSSSKVSKKNDDSEVLSGTTEKPTAEFQQLKEKEKENAKNSTSESTTNKPADPTTKAKADAALKQSTPKQNAAPMKGTTKSKSTSSVSESKPARKGIKLSFSSEVVNTEGKEVDAMSESGLSTMSSGSVQSCMSLPPNPLARSTSWADLVRKGKSESPVPVPTGKVTHSSKYQSTPSRYLNHRQTGAKTGTKTATQPALLSKSRSLPNQRGLQTNKISGPVHKGVIKPRESHVCEEGWCVSSGKSRVKTIPNSSKKAEPAVKTSPVMSPRLATRSAVKSSADSTVSTSKAKVSEVGPRTKSSDSIEKPKNSRILKTKPSTKAVSTKINSKPSTSTVAKSSTVTRTSRPSTTSARGSSKPLVSKPKLIKARSLESNTKLSDKLKATSGDMKKGISKSSDPLVKPTTSESKPKKEIGEPIKELAKEIEPSVIDSTISEPLISSDSEEPIDPTIENLESILTSSTENSSSASDAMVQCLGVSELDNSKVISESKSIQTDATQQMLEDHVEIFAVPASSIYPKLEETEETCNIYRVMISKRKRQISEQSSVSTDTLEDEDRLCLSPGRSPVRSPGSRSSGGGRSPGKAPQLHQRLSSPSRRRNTTDTMLKNYQERLAKAQVQRDKIQEEKAVKLKKIKIKEEQVKDLQEQQEKERVARAISHAEKLARAEQLRDKKIAEVKRKAQEEEQKVNEIAFINTLEAQNRKMELLSKEQSAEAKRVELQVRQQEERKRRSEELQAKEDAVQERKQAIEADRLARIAHIEDKIKESQAKVDLNKLEMETAAKEAAKDRALERELTRELVRHDRSNSSDLKGKNKGRQQMNKLKEWQQKAAMLCQHLSSDYLPTHTLYQPPKWCSKCNIKIVSEAVLMAHMIKRHQKSSQDEAELESQYIIDYTDELCPMAQDVITRQKMLRKRSKKVKTRISNKIMELPSVKLLEPPKDCPNKNRLFKCIKAMKNQKTREKGLGDLSRTILTNTDINHLIDKGVVEQLCQLLSERKLLAPISKLLIQCSSLSPTGCQICVRSLADIVDCLQSVTSITTPAIYSDLLRLTAALVRSLTPCDGLTSDIVSYIISKEIVDNIQTTCNNTYFLKDEGDCSVLISSLQLLSACCIAMTTPNVPISSSPTKNDSSQLVDTLVFTKACNIVTLLYGVLLYEGPPRVPPPLPETTLQVVRQCLETLLDISRFSLHTLQSVMDSEGMSMELRHVCSYVLSSASHHNYTYILDLCVQVIGFVVFSHPSNQALLQNGPSPSILQLLSSLPFSYFSDIRSMNLLFPTLISACHNCPSNLATLQQKVNKVMLISYLKDQLRDTKEKHINHYPRPVFQQALKFLGTPEVEDT